MPVNIFKLINHLDTKLESSVDFGHGWMVFLMIYQMLVKRVLELWQDDVRKLSLFSKGYVVAYVSLADKVFLKRGHALDLSFN